MRPIKIIKNRSDIGAGTRGSDMGIDAIEVAAINADNDYFTRFPYVDVKTDNETVYTKVHAIFAKRIGYVHEQCRRVADAIGDAISTGHFPVMLSGDHSSSLGTISGIKSQYPDKRLGIIWIDAHPDLHSPYTTPSGNVHGMPLAAALWEDNIERRVNEVTDHTQHTWEDLKRIGTDSPKLDFRDLVFFGARDIDPAEAALMNAKNIRNYRVEEIRFRGMKTCLEEAGRQLADCDILYISFDVDSMDCNLVSRGTGTPVEKGFDPGEVTDIIRYFLATDKVACLEVTEVNPLLDNRGNRMAETAFGVLDAVTKSYVEQNGQ